MIRIETSRGCGQTPRVVFALEECGAAYDLVVLEDGHFVKEHGRQGPRLVDGDLSLLEGPAILRHCARASGGGRLMPADLPALARVDSWIDFSGLRIGLVLRDLFIESRRPEARPEVVAELRQTLATALGILDKALADGRTWLEGDTLTAADCSLVLLARLGDAVDLARWPAVQAYRDRLAARPAFARSMARLQGRIASPEEVLAFWFDEPAGATDLMASLRRWFQGGAAMDAEVTARFGATIDAALRGELDGWADGIEGRLALVLVLDQLTRNRFRDDARTWSGDARAQQLAVEVLERGLDAGLETTRRLFLLMPLLHAEDVRLQERGLEAARAIAREAPASRAELCAMHLEQAAKYGDVIRLFGRFPHRNVVLGRTSTPEEVEFLKGWADRAPPARVRAMVAAG